MIYIIKQEGWYQNKVSSSLFSIYNCKMAIHKLEVQICFDLRLQDLLCHVIEPSHFVS